ncbi:MULTISPECIES: hypothetical protein [unclassified Curtobacterium]|uniref:hypothetical protein n=1 Tax=unclassified Curtobacterium TaxID=257496 RepID=UPI0011B3D0B0|nr:MULTISPECIES: hypothetical protein [unclassified Curtobacterium]
MSTASRWTAVVVAAVALVVGVVLVHAGGDGAQLVVAGRGPGTITQACWLVGALAAAYAAVTWAWHLTRSGRSAGRTVARAAAALLSVGLLGCALGSVVLSSLGGSVRYVDVGSASGHTVTVAEYRSLGGRQLQLGFRDGWSFRPAAGARAWANSNQVETGPSSTDEDVFRLHVDGSRVLVDHGGDQPLEARLPG